MFRLSKIFFLLKILIVLLVSLSLGSCEEDLVEDVDTIDIPAYYFENNYLDERIKAINNAIAECADGCETFFWITDIHWEPDRNTRMAPLLIKYIASKTGVNKILNGGDTGDSQVICKDAIFQLRAAIGSDKVYTVTGNHEIVGATIYERPFIRVAEELRGHNSDIVYGDDNQSYFYYENNESKTRYIGLSSFGLYINNECESCYTAEQLEWFKNVALNVLEGWQIIVFTHSLYSITSTDKLRVVRLAGAADFIDAIDEYEGNGIISCVLMGHTHRDRIHIGSAGVPYIITASDRHAPYYGDINVTRIPGTISEQHFEVVVINKSKRQIELFSIGANARDGYEDEPGNEVDIRIVGY